MRTNNRAEMYFYTYAYLREDKTPYYIGKGSGKRICDNRRKTKPPKDKSRIIFLKQNLTEEEAFRHEIYMIAVFGRKDLGTGILHNRTNGGEGMSGYKISDKTREKMSAAKKGSIFSPEHRAKIGASNSRRSVSQETREKFSKWSRSEETRKKMSEKRSINNKGRKWFCNLNGDAERFCHEGNQPDGWILGRNSSNLGRKLKKDT